MDTYPASRVNLIQAGDKTDQVNYRLRIIYKIRSIDTDPFDSRSGGKMGHVDQVHLSYLFMHRVDADLARIGTPARMKITSIQFTEIRIGVKTADIVSPIVFHIV